MDRGLRHIALRTRDLWCTERFYVDVLGLRTAFPHEGMIFLETPGGRDLLNFVAPADVRPCGRRPRPLRSAFSARRVEEGLRARQSGGRQGHGPAKRDVDLRRR